MGKLQSTSLKFGIVGILHPEVWEIGFLPWNLVSLAKLDFLLVLTIKWHASMLKIIIIFLAKSTSQNEAVSLKINNTTGASKATLFWEADLAKTKYTPALQRIN